VLDIVSQTKQGVVFLSTSQSCPIQLTRLAANITYHQDPCLSNISI